MKDEGRATGGLDPDHDRPRQPRLRWGRRSPYGYPRYDRGQGETGHTGPTYAALDLGTNNCRLLVARPTDDGFTVIDAFSRVVRLGEGMATSGKLAEGAMDRAVAALSVCAEKLRRRHVSRFGRLGDRRAKSPSARRAVIRAFRQDVGFYATFSFALALL